MFNFVIFLGEEITAPWRIEIMYRRYMAYLAIASYTWQLTLCVEGKHYS